MSKCSKAWAGYNRCKYSSSKYCNIQVTYEYIGDKINHLKKVLPVGKIWIETQQLDTMSQICIYICMASLAFPIIKIIENVNKTYTQE